MSLSLIGSADILPSLGRMKWAGWVFVYKLYNFELQQHNNLPHLANLPLYSNLHSVIRTYDWPFAFTSPVTAFLSWGGVWIPTIQIICLISFISAKVEVTFRSETSFSYILKTSATASSSFSVDVIRRTDPSHHLSQSQTFMVTVNSDLRAEKLCSNCWK